MTSSELEMRLINFAVSIIAISGKIKRNYAGMHLAKQIIRSGTSPALNYAEARGAESRKDFLHKIKIVLKELRETLVSLTIIEKSDLMKHDNAELKNALVECNELVAIFVASTKTGMK